MLKIIVIFCLLFKITATKTIICDSPKEINLNENEIVFFESPNFPLSINETIKKEDCKLNVRGNFVENANMSLIFVITNGYISGGKIDDGKNVQLINASNVKEYFFHTKEPSFNFSFSSNKLETWEGFQGFVTYETISKYKCPLSEKNNTFKFENESQILYLRSSYYSFNLWPINKVECAWRFSGPEGYAFKIDVLNTTSKILVVSNGTRDFITRQQPYYYNNSNIIISYTSIVIHGVLQNNYFTARVSIIDPQKPKPDDCSTLLSRDKKVIWETSLNGYINNINCQKIIYAPPNFQVYANVTFLQLEKNVDILRYYSDEELLHPAEIDDERVYVFPPKNKTHGRNLTFEFSSDDSVTSKGFRIEFETVECSCGNPIFVIPCADEKTFSIMDNENFLYCVDLKCEYTIIFNDSCPDSYAVIQTFFTPANRAFDNFQLISDGHILLNISGTCPNMFKGMSQSAFILPNRTTILKFESSSKLDFDHSGSQAWPVNDSVAVGMFKLVATVVPAPSVNPKMQILNENMRQVIKINEMKVNSLQIIELSNELKEENDHLELIYGTSDIEHMICCITLYDDESMTSVRHLNVFNSSLILGTSLTIYKHMDCNSEFTELNIKAKNSNSINCIFHNNFVSLEEIMKTNKIFTMMSSSNQSCQITLINNVGGQYAIKNLWTTNKTDNVFVFNDADDSLPTFQFNSNTASKWKNMILNAMALSLIIPKQSSLIVEFYIPFPGISFTEPLESFYETPFYGTRNFQPISYNLSYEIFDGLVATFTVSNINLSDEGKLLVIDDKNEIYSLKHAKQSIIVNGSITVFYSEPKLGYKGAFIQIQVEKVSEQPLVSQNLSTLGWDGIQQVSVDGYKCLAQNGFSFYIGRIYRSIGIPDIHGIQNIKNARAAGWKKVSGYIFPCLRIGCPRPKDQIEAAIGRVLYEGAQIDMLWISVRQNEWPADMVYNRLFILELIKHAETMGVKVGIYTSRDNWDLIVGLNWNGAADKPLWYALFNGQPNFNGFTPFGGWKSPSMHHFKVTARGPCDVEMNYSWYN